MVDHYVEGWFWHKSLRAAGPKPVIIYQSDCRPLVTPRSLLHSLGGGTPSPRSRSLENEAFDQRMLLLFRGEVSPGQMEALESLDLGFFIAWILTA